MLVTFVFTIKYSSGSNGAPSLLWS